MARISEHRNAALGGATRQTQNAALPASSRLAVVDGLRGFALLGILVINLGAFSNTPGAPPDFFRDVPVADRVLQALILLGVESKFFSLFSLLFGLSFALQLDSAARQGARFGPRIARRLAALAGFGMLHVLLIWDGDILLIYALVGALLVAFRNVGERRLRRWITGLLLLPLTVYLVALVGVLVARVVPSTREGLTALDEMVRGLSGDVVARNQLLGAGSYGQIAVSRWNDYASTLPLLLSRTPTILAMFLTGMWVGRRGVLRDPRAHLPLLRRVCRVGWLVGAPVQLLVVIASLTLAPLTALGVLFLDQALTGPSLALAYAATFVLAVQTGAGAALTRLLAPVGRMALTTYLSQSVILSFLFWSWGLGLVGRVSTAQGLALVVLIYAAQLGFAHLWLRRFRYGPLEWLWRSATYWRWQPLRKEASSHAPPRAEGLSR